MADIFDFDEFRQNLTEAADSLARLNTGVNSSARANTLYERASRDAQNAIREEVRVRREGVENIKREFSGFLNSMSGTGKALTSGSSNFTTLNSVVSSTITTMGSFASGLARLVPIFGEGLGKLIDTGAKAIAEGGQIVIQQFEVGFSAFKQAAKIGAIDTFTDLRVTSDKLNLRMEELANVLVTNGDKLTQIGGSAIAGKNAFQQLADGSDQLRREFLRLGTDTQEFSNLQIGMLNQFARTGKSLKDVDRIQSDYMNNLQLISELTGKNKETLQRERDERLNEFKFRSQFEKLSKREQMDLQAKLDFAKKVNPEYEKALKGYIGTGGLIIGKQLQTSFLRSGGAERDVAMRMNRMSMQDFIRESIGVGQRVKGRVDPYARVLDESSSIIGSGITGYYDLANLKEEDIKKLQQGIQQNRENRDSETAQLADTSTALQRAGVNLQQLAVGVDVAKDAMSSFAGVIETLTSKLKTYFGAGKTSAGSSNASASGVAVEGAGAANANAVMEGAAGGAQVPADTPVTGGTSSRPISRSMGMPGMMPTSADASDMETTPAGFSDRERDLPHYVNMFEWGSGDARMTRFALLDENLKKNMTRAARDYYELTGRKLIFRSGLRTKEEQKLLYDRWIKKGKTGYPVAKPGQSRHESGFSLDINDDQADFLDRKGILAKYGLDRPVRNDPVHIELSGQRRPGGRKRVQEAALGGIVEAVAGGRQLIAAEAGMNEAFVPLPDGKTIPVTMSENGVFGDIKSLLSDIRGLLESGNGIYRKQMMIARN